ATIRDFHGNNDADQLPDFFHVSPVQVYSKYLLHHLHQMTPIIETAIPHVKLSCPASFIYLHKKSCHIFKPIVFPHNKIPQERNSPYGTYGAGGGT
ncbi:hypothetical protein, partial [Dialister invisus]|uniref:hypothetical protein n=1 Tax=Dialister invisus TaxID=218538 RepID=UPI003AF9AA08